MTTKRPLDFEAAERSAMALTSNDGVREGWGAEKSRVVTWRDPVPTAAIAASMDGWEFVDAIMDHRLPSPPIQQLMQFELVSAEPGRTVFTCAPDESAYNAIGAVCGGLAGHVWLSPKAR